MPQRGLEQTSVIELSSEPDIKSTSFSSARESQYGNSLAEKDIRVVPLTEEELRTRLFPVDEIGMPLPLYVPLEYRTDRYKYDEHHHWGPRKKMLRKHSNLGKTLRYSRVQIVPIELHRRFNRHFDKTPLAKTRVARLGQTLLAVARYIPREALDVRPSVPERRELTLSERQTMWANNEIRLERVATVQNFLLSEVTKQELQNADPDEIEEFVNTNDNDRKIKLGKKLFRLAAKMTVEPVEFDYMRAWEGGLLPRQDLRAINGESRGIIQTRALPKEARLFLARHLITNEYLEKTVINNFRERLRKRQIGVLATR